MALNFLTRISPENIDKTYMNELNRIKPLSKEDNYSLAKSTDSAKEEKMIRGNLRLVIKIAYYYSMISGYEIMDLIQEGNLSLIKAVRKYNPTLGAFSSFATRLISQDLSNIVNGEIYGIRKSEILRRKEKQYLDIIKEYQAKNLPIPNDEELCRLLHTTKDFLADIKKCQTITVSSLDKEINDEKESPLIEFISLDNNIRSIRLEKEELQDFILTIKNILSPFEYYIIYNRQIIEPKKTQQELASSLNVDHEFIRQTENNILKKLKKYMLNDYQGLIEAYKKMSRNEGKNLSRLKIKPILPINIIKYLYLLPNLTYLEKKLYKEYLFGKYNYNKFDYCKYLNVSEETLNNIIISLKSKINSIKNHLEEFTNFRNNLLSLYKSKIFKINLEDNDINYQNIISTYGNLEYAEVLNYFNDTNISLSKEDFKLLQRYFNASALPNISKEEIEKEINLTITGYKLNSTRLPINKLYQAFLIIENNLSIEEKLYLECFLFGKLPKSFFLKRFPQSKLLNSNSNLIYKLEKAYFNINVNNTFELLGLTNNQDSIEINLSYDKDIKPLLKYFSLIDKLKINDYFVAHLSISKMALKYHLSEEEIIKQINSLKYRINELITNKNCLKFDFDMYKKLINEDSLPFTGDLKLAIKIFDLVTGESGLEKINSENIAGFLKDKSYTSSYCINIIESLLLSIYKRNLNIRKDNIIPFEMIYSYYEFYKEVLTKNKKETYKKYIKDYLSGLNPQIKDSILLDMLKKNNRDYFSMNFATKKEAEKLLNRYDNQLPIRIKTFLIKIFNLNERTYMNSHELKRVYKLLNELDIRRQYLNSKNLKLST